MPKSWTKIIKGRNVNLAISYFLDPIDRWVNTSVRWIALSAHWTTKPGIYFPFDRWMFTHANNSHSFLVLQSIPHHSPSPQINALLSRILPYVLDSWLIYEVLTLYTLTQYAYSPDCSLPISLGAEKENLFKSHDFNQWFRADIVRRNSIILSLITSKTLGVLT